MRILVPLNKKDRLEDYIACGASEFYLGFYDNRWRVMFGDYADINRLTGFKESANPHSFEEVLSIVRENKRKDIKIFITFNSSLYSSEQLLQIEYYMEQLKDSDCDGVIVSCIELVQLAKRYDLYCVISTIAGVYNQDIARFYVKHGANRIILPRDLSVDEIETIVNAVPEVEYEVFIMRNGCAYSDSHCLGMHRKELCSVCSTLCKASHEFVLSEDDFKNRHDAELNNYLFCNEFHNITCGVCSIYRFVKMGISAGKIVGRSDDSENICNDIRIVKNNIDLAQDCNSQEEYLDRMYFPTARREICKMGLSCYYPEMRF